MMWVKVNGLSASRRRDLGWKLLVEIPTPRYRGLRREISHDEIRPRSPYPEQRLQHDALAIDPPALRSRAYHRVFATHLIGGYRVSRLGFHTRNNVEIGSGGLHHHGVCAFLDVGANFTHCFFGVTGIHLVAPSIAGLRRRLCRLAEWTVVARCILRRVAENRGIGKIVFVERRSDRADSTIHHVTRRDDVRAGTRV